MEIPDDLTAAYSAVIDALEAEAQWQQCFNDLDPHSAGTVAAGRAVSAVLLLTGPRTPRYVDAWSDDTTSLSAHVFTDDALIAVRVDPPAADNPHGREVHVKAVPLLVDALSVTASATPWEPTHGSTPRWPGTVTATVQIRGLAPIKVPAQRFGNQAQRDAVSGLVHHLAARLHGQPS